MYGERGRIGLITLASDSSVLPEYLRLMPDGAMVYFVHSYLCRPADPEVVVATADHGGPFCAVLQRDNVIATQFHPEKSGEIGLRMLDNFARL